MRIAPPPGGTSLFDHEPELFATFNQLYGTLWSNGVLDEGDQGSRPPAQRAQGRLQDLPQPALRGRDRGRV